MNKQLSIKRYEKLIEIMRGLSRHERKYHFNMREWGRNTQCGTVCCAAGHAGLDRWFVDNGFKSEFGTDEYGHMKVDAEIELAYAGHQSWSAIRYFFDDGANLGEIDSHPVFGMPETVGEVIRAATRRIKQLKKEVADGAK